MSVNEHVKRVEITALERPLLTIEEASAYTGNGVTNLSKISKEYGGKLVLWVGNKRLFKRKPLEEYLEKEYSS